MFFADSSSKEISSISSEMNRMYSKMLRKSAFLTIFDHMQAFSNAFEDIFDEVTAGVGKKYGKFKHWD